MCELAKCAVSCAGVKSLVLCPGGVLVVARVVVHVVVCLVSNVSRAFLVVHLRALLRTKGNIQKMYDLYHSWLVVGRKQLKAKQLETGQTY